MITHNFEYKAPGTIGEAVRILNEDSNAVIIAGGSDILPQLKTDVIEPSILCDLKNIDGLKKIEVIENNMYIGSMVLLSALAEDENIINNFPAISQSARNVASPQIRNRGTIGGNILQARRCMYYNQTKKWREGMEICYKVGGDVCLQIKNSADCRAIYYSDVATALLALGAKVEVYSADKLEIRDLKEVIDDHIKDLPKRFVLGRFIIPMNGTKSWNRFIKYSLRGSIDFPIINFAAKSIENNCKLYVGAIGTNIIELSDTEKYINENASNLNKDSIAEVAVAEMKSKSELVREIGLTINVKRSSFNLVEEIIGELLDDYKNL